LAGVPPTILRATVSIGAIVAKRMERYMDFLVIIIVVILLVAMQMNQIEIILGQSSNNEPFVWKEESILKRSRKKIDSRSKLDGFLWILDTKFESHLAVIGREY
jgi:hypothetical protein